METTADVFCTATLNYVTVTDGAEPVGAAVDVDVLDGRTADLPGWETCGFELVDHTARIDDWSDDQQVADVHRAEMETLARAMTGADHALVPGHITRSPTEAARHQDLGPIAFVHSDFAASYLDKIRDSYRSPTEGGQAALARNSLTPADLHDASRIVILQFWRNVGPAKMDLPLAFCDARTIGPHEVHPIAVEDYAGTGFDFEALAIRAPSDSRAHRWCAFPEMGRDEVVAFRTYDTDLVAAGGTFFTPHSAFRDPDVALGAPARSSIELRATCLFA